jgi:DNA-binding protein HU-beta
MNKSELVDAIASEANLSKADAAKALAGIINATTKSLKKGENVTLVGFGTFSVTKRAARTGINPQTKKTIQIKAKKVAKFKPGSELAKTVNK